MFDNKYMTKRVQEEISLDIQLILYNLIEKWKEEFKELDYLQIFNLSISELNGIRVQKIEHKQEVPDIQETKYYKIDNPINAKIFVIDENDNSVMMFSEEY